MSKQRLAILISGRGSNMLALARACASGEIHADVALVISNRKDAAGIQGAQKLGLEVIVIEHTAYESRVAFDSAITRRLDATKPDWIVLAGFMRILSTSFVKRWEGRILNIHPSLLPKYKGLETHARALEAGDAQAGCSVHVVTSQLDGGPVLGQARADIEPGETPQTLAAKVLKLEHRLYPEVLRRFALGDNEPLLVT